MPSPARSPTSRSQTQTAGSARPWLSPGMLHSARPHGRQYLQMATRGYQNRIRYSGVGTSPIRPTDGPLARQPVETLLSEPPGSTFLHRWRLRLSIVASAASIADHLSFRPTTHLVAPVHQGTAALHLSSAIGSPHFTALGAQMERFALQSLIDHLRLRRRLESQKR